jgi:hypothetical protein
MALSAGVSLVSTVARRSRVRVLRMGSSREGDTDCGGDSDERADLEIVHQADSLGQWRPGLPF